MIYAPVPLWSCGTEGALVLGNSCLEGGSPQLAALSQASSAWSRLNFLGLKTLPGTLFPPPHFSSELLQNWMPSLELFKYLSSGPEYTSVDFYFVGTPQPIKGGFNELKRMLSKYFIIGKLFTPVPREPRTKVRAVCRHLTQTADTRGGEHPRVSSATHSGRVEVGGGCWGDTSNGFGWLKWQALGMGEFSFRCCPTVTSQSWQDFAGRVVVWGATSLTLCAPSCKWRMAFPRETLLTSVGLLYHLLCCLPLSSSDPK